MAASHSSADRPGHRCIRYRNWARYLEMMVVGASENSDAGYQMISLFQEGHEGGKDRTHAR